MTFLAKVPHASVDESLWACAWRRSNSRGSIVSRRCGPHGSLADIEIEMPQSGSGTFPGHQTTPAYEQLSSEAAALLALTCLLACHKHGVDVQPALSANMSETPILP